MTERRLPLFVAYLMCSSRASNISLAVRMWRASNTWIQFDWFIIFRKWFDIYLQIGPLDTPDASWCIAPGKTSTSYNFIVSQIVSTACFNLLLHLFPAFNVILGIFPSQQLHINCDWNQCFTALNLTVLSNRSILQEMIWLVEEFPILNGRM